MNEMTEVLGIVAMEPKGEYDSSAYYEKLNVVTYNDSTYMAIQPSNNVLPTDTDYWQLIGGGVTKEVLKEEIIDRVESFDTVALMKSAPLKEGMTIKTLGYYSANDGGGATYYITSTESSSDKQETVGSLYATLIADDYVNVDQFGAKGDGTSDDTAIIQEALDYCFAKNKHLKLSKKTYIITSPLIINKSGIVKIIIDGNNGTIKGTFDDYLIKANIQNSEQVIIQNVALNGNFTSKGILFHRSQRFSLKNVSFNYCLKGLVLKSCWYGNVDNNCYFNTCLHAINLEEDEDDQYHGENNTIEFDNVSIDGHSTTPAAFNSTDPYSTGIYIEGVVHAVKFAGVIVESVAIGVSGGKTAQGAQTTILGNVTFDKCYFENMSQYFIDWTGGTSTNSIILNIIFTNCNVWPLGTATARLNYGRFYFQNNSVFKIVPYADNRNLEIITDMNDYYIDDTTINYTTRIEKLENRVVRTTTMRYDQPATAQTYPSSSNMNIAVQNDDYLMYQFYLNNNNVTIKNSKALAINSKNISFDKQGLNPVGLVIDGTDGNKYMLSTDDGSSLNFIKMSNLERIYDKPNCYDAYWLYAHKDELPDGFKSHCIDINKNVKLVKTGSTGEWWTDEANSYLCIGTSKSLYDNLSNQPTGIYWRPCWDLSFNRAVFWHSNVYNLSYDWAMNNNPQSTATQIRAYGTISQRPSTPTYDSIYYATDEEKYYVYTGGSWSETTKIM